MWEQARNNAVLRFAMDVGEAAMGKCVCVREGVDYAGNVVECVFGVE
jgi:hypothetical protein